MPTSEIQDLVSRIENGDIPHHQVRGYIDSLHSRLMNGDMSKYSGAELDTILELEQKNGFTSHAQKLFDHPLYAEKVTLQSIDPHLPQGRVFDIPEEHVVDLAKGLAVIYRAIGGTLLAPGIIDKADNPTGETRKKQPTQSIEEYIPKGVAIHSMLKNLYMELGYRVIVEEYEFEKSPDFSRATLVVFRQNSIFDTREVIIDITYSNKNGKIATRQEVLEILTKREDPRPVNHYDVPVNGFEVQVISGLGDIFRDEALQALMFLGMEGFALRPRKHIQQGAKGMYHGYSVFYAPQSIEEIPDYLPDHIDYITAEGGFALRDILELERKQELGMD